jgi:hypothetical protein
MNSKDTFSKINAIEKRIDIASFHIGDFNIWPIIRLHIGYTADSYLTKKPTRNTKELFLKAIKKFLKIPFILTLYIYNYIFDYSKNDNFSQRDLLFITYGTSRRIKLDEGYFDTYLDPFIEVAKQTGRTFLVLETNNSKYLVPRYNKSIFITPIIDFIQLYSGFISKFKSTEKIRILLTDLNNILLELGLDLIDSKVIENKVIFLKLLSNYFERVLLKVKPNAVFTSNFYGIEFALIAACRNLEIPTIDVQHGSQSSIHYAYGHWENIPKNGFDLLPDIFWVWDKKYKENKICWLNKNNRHKVIVGGNPVVFLNSFNDKALINYRISIKSILGIRKKMILISLDSDQLSVLEFYIELMKSVQDDKIFWGFRFHPSTSEINKQIIRNKIKPYIDYNIDLFSDIPLFLVLIETSIHLTETSSVVLDAINFNIPSVVVHEDSLIFYAEQIKNGSVTYLKNINEIKMYILNSKPTLKKESIIRIAKRSFNSNVNKLFKEYRL